jgi:hypothetical protein
MTTATCTTDATLTLSIQRTGPIAIVMMQLLQQH